MRWDELRWGEKSSDEMRWDEMKSGVWSVVCEECSVKCEVWSFKCDIWQWSTFAQSTQSRASLAHGACKFCTWKKKKYIYIIPRQLPPRLLPVLLYIECPQIIVLLIGIVTDHLRVVYPCFFLLECAWVFGDFGVPSWLNVGFGVRSMWTLSPRFVRCLLPPPNQVLSWLHASRRSSIRPGWSFDLDGAFIGRPRGHFRRCSCEVCCPNCGRVKDPLQMARSAGVW